MQERTREGERVGGSRKRLSCALLPLLSVGFGLELADVGLTALQRWEGEIEDGGARGLRIFVDSSGFRPAESLEDRSKEEGDHRAVEAIGDDDAQDDGAVLSSVGPPLASVTPSRFALTSLPLV